MGTIKIAYVAFVRFRAPDLGAMRGFLEDFGLTAVEATDRRLVMRGASTAPVLHVTEFGEPGFAGVAFRAANVADVKRLAAAESAIVEVSICRAAERWSALNDPDDHHVEIVAGQTSVSPLGMPIRSPGTSRRNTAAFAPQARPSRPGACGSGSATWCSTFPTSAPRSVVQGPFRFP